MVGPCGDVVIAAPPPSPLCIVGRFILVAWGVKASATVSHGTDRLWAHAKLEGERERDRSPLELSRIPCIESSSVNPDMTIEKVIDT